MVPAPLPWHDMSIKGMGKGGSVLLDDNPIASAAEDKFGFEDHAAVFCDAIRTTDSLPLTIGVLGAWGAGKSSFLNICRGLLDADAEKRYLTASFNAWKYDQRDQIWHALIQTILDEAVQRAAALPASTSRKKQLIRDARKLSGVIAWLAARSAAPPLTAGVISGSDIDALRGAIRSLRQAGGHRHALGYRHVNRFEKDFADTVNALTGARRLVLFIDDLDRCEAEEALQAADVLHFTVNF
jgi:predicted KAP-like P-loop ATPase